MFETIKYEVKNNVAWITLNRPDKLNAFIRQLNLEIQKAVKDSSRNEEVRAIVITGEGRAFCSGQDLSEVDESMDHGEVLRHNYVPMVKEIEQCEKPVIAAVNGVAAGAGFSLALACDFRLVSEKASFVQAFVHVGLVPDSGNLYYLSKIVGYAKALELAVFGEKIKAIDAEKLGLVTKIISLEEWQEETAAFAERIAAMPTKAIGLMKRLLKGSADLSFQEYLEKEAYAQRIAGQTEDHREGVMAFMEKRRPAFHGK
ncbi:enoyl-CoA hydratase-related protein [Rossellomorea yichunensis]|uniref:enoyl-CoA hydratase-related protein n=1 Tax=Rossellomorea yichunensis TaxID=3077331 RepID=UPI0028DF52E4|nr:enoyl-CoA hydratase-related protein [Rossellomorea sp. YC4-1]MDT9026063.1 enoyl-CoA hydratase-related protein [Rossellomorea sp. YC4-1]